MGNDLAGNQSSIQPPEGQDLARTVESIMSNPEFAGIINELRGGNAADRPPISQGEILSRLPEVMSMLKPLIGAEPSAADHTAQGAADAPDKSVPVSAEPAKAVLPVLPKKYDKSRAEKLMSALKPYLNSSRCEIIDKCVSVMQITDVMEAIQGLEGITGTKKP